MNLIDFVLWCTDERVSVQADENIIVFFFLSQQNISIFGMPTNFIEFINRIWSTTIHIQSASSSINDKISIDIKILANGMECDGWKVFFLISIWRRKRKSAFFSRYDVRFSSVFLIKFRSIYVHFFFFWLVIRLTY